MLILEKIRSFFSENVLASEVQTTKGLLFWPNNDPSVGPKYLVRLHFPLEPTSVDWSEMEKYIDGGNLAVCKNFFLSAMGFP